jgi:hypothetical protein
MFFRGSSEAIFRGASPPRGYPDPPIRVRTQYIAPLQAGSSKTSPARGAASNCKQGHMPFVMHDSAYIVSCCLLYLPPCALRFFVLSLAGGTCHRHTANYVHKAVDEPKPRQIAVQPSERIDERSAFASSSPIWRAAFVRSRLLKQRLEANTVQQPIREYLGMRWDYDSNLAISSERACSGDGLIVRQSE